MTGTKLTRLAAIVIIVTASLVALFAPVIATDEPWLARAAGSTAFPAFTPGTSTWDVCIVGAPVPWDPDDIRLRERLQSPDRDHWLGTDELGRDVLARMIAGTRVSITVGFAAGFLSLLLGGLLGGLAGYLGGWVDAIVSRLIEIVLCFPFLFLVMAIMAVLGPSLTTIVIALGVSGWTGEARIVRAEMLRLREMPWAEAARASGAGTLRIVLRHLLPSALPPLLTSTSFTIATAILVESALSFLGFGVALPQASWGSILASADEHLRRAWWLAFFPGLAIVLTVAALHRLGERDDATGMTL